MQKKRVASINQDELLHDAVIYARYSSHGQTEQSIEGQLRYCYDFAEKNGYTIVGEYIDRALSGTKAETRPEFQRMIHDARKKQFQYILVWKLDRFARNRYDSAIYKSDLKKFGVRVLSVTESIGDGDESIILEAVLEAMAEKYSRDLSSNVQRGLRESALKGNSTGGSIPLGYKIVQKSLVIDESTAPIVQYIFKQYASGMGKKAIADELNRRGYRTRKGDKFNHNSFYRILQNKKYIGIYHYDTAEGTIEVEDGCPALVDKETFEKCQKIAKLSQRAPGHNKASVEYMLYGKLYCGHCGSIMVADCGKGRNGTVHHYYTCAGRKKRRTGEVKCDKKLEKKDYIEWYICNQAVSYVLEPKNIDIIAEVVVAKYNSKFDNNLLKILSSSLKKIDHEISEAVEALIKTSSKAALAKINEKLDYLEQRKTDIETEIKKAKITQEAKLTKSDVVTFLHQFCHGNPLDKEFQKRIIDIFINRVYLYDDHALMYFNITGNDGYSLGEPINKIPDENCGTVRICDTIAHQEKCFAY